MVFTFKIMETLSQDKSALHPIIHNRSLSKRLQNQSCAKGETLCRSGPTQDDEEDPEPEGDQVPQGDAGQRDLLGNMDL